MRVIPNSKGEQDGNLADLLSSVQQLRELRSLKDGLAAEFGLPQWELLQKTADAINHGDYKRALQLAECLADACRDQFYAVHWSEVSLSWRHMYTCACACAALSLLVLNQFNECVRWCDMGFLMGAPVREACLRQILKIAEQYVLLNDNSAIGTVEFPTIPDIATLTCNQCNRLRPIPRVEAPSLEGFLVKYLNSETPVIITGAMEHWPALNERKWSIQSLYHRFGHRSVPVEIGSKYTDEDWTQRIMTLGDFLIQYLNPNVQEKGYLAQHNIFDQIQELRFDVAVPDYCYLEPTTAEEKTGDSLHENQKVGDMGDVRLNAWLGPADTVSPLHYDTDHNMFCQVMGAKYLRLFSPQMTECLYPFQDHLLSNTSQIKSENVDLNEFPQYRNADGWECVVGPGEMLYIPQGWWHYVRSVQPSFSCSFWWK
eukprot:CFRG8355T1